MEIFSITGLAILGIILGAITNRNGILGNGFLNFAFAAALAAYESLAAITSFPRIPHPILVLVSAYIVGTFTQKLLARMPGIIGQLSRSIGGAKA